MRLTRTRKYGVPILILVVILALAAGCGTSNNNNNGTNTPPPTNNGNANTNNPPAAATGDAEAGLALYKANCLACHGTEGANGHNGPNLQVSSVAENFDEVVDKIHKGGATMPAFANKLTDAEINDIATYITQVVAPLG